MNIIETNLSFKSMSVRSKTTRLILHHAAAKSCGAATIHQWHLNNGWSGIGYHFVVRKNGTIERGRPEKYVGAHAEGSNSDSIGICFEGDFMSEKMTDTQKNAGKELVAYLKKKYSISKVQKHSDVCSTDCPGKNFPLSEITGAAASSGASKPAASTSKPTATKYKQIKVDKWWGTDTTRLLQQMTSLNQRLETIRSEIAAASDTGDQQRLDELKIQLEEIVAEYEALKQQIE